MSEVSVDEMIDAVEPDKPDNDKVDGNDVIQQSWHNQDQDARDEGNDRRNVCGSENHNELLMARLSLLDISQIDSNRFFSLHRRASYG